MTSATSRAPGPVAGIAVEVADRGSRHRPSVRFHHAARHHGAGRGDTREQRQGHGGPRYAARVAHAGRGSTWWADRGLPARAAMRTRPAPRAAASPRPRRCSGPGSCSCPRPSPGPPSGRRGARPGGPAAWRRPASPGPRCWPRAAARLRARSRPRRRRGARRSRRRRPRLRRWRSRRRAKSTSTRAGCAVVAVARGEEVAAARVAHRQLRGPRQRERVGRPVGRRHHAQVGRGGRRAQRQEYRARHLRQRQGEQRARALAAASQRVADGRGDRIAGAAHGERHRVRTRGGDARHRLLVGERVAAAAPASCAPERQREVAAGGGRAQELVEARIERRAAVEIEGEVAQRGRHRLAELDAQAGLGQRQRLLLHRPHDSWE